MIRVKLESRVRQTDEKRIKKYLKVVRGLIKNLNLERKIKIIKRYGWHGLRVAGVILKLLAKKIYKWLLRNIKRRLIRYINKVDRMDSEWREDDLLIDIVRYSAKRLFDTKRYIQMGKDGLKEMRNFFRPPEGTLSWKRVATIASRNLLNGKARVWVTTGGVTVGIGAIVLLVSLGFGLEKVVTNRIIWPDALKIAEVTTESANVKLDQTMLNRLAGLLNVKKLAPSVRLAGQVDFNGSKMDVVLVGAENEFFTLNDLKIVMGKNFSEAANARYISGTNEAAETALAAAASNSGEVAGVSTEMVPIEIGDTVSSDKIRFRIRDDSYSATYNSPKTTAATAGFVKGSVLESYPGIWVWGGVYDDLSGSGRSITSLGTVMGKWVKASVPLWSVIDGGVYQAIKNEDGSQKTALVYLPATDVQVLSESEVELERMLSDPETVLGESTAIGSAEASASAILQSGDMLSSTSSTVSAKLLTELDKTQKAAAAANNQDVVLPIRSNTPKEIIISQALVKAWNKNIGDVLDHTIDVSYMVTSSLLPDVNGRVFSEKTPYQIVGVVEDDSKPMAYVPVGDVESLGINTYSSAMVLVGKETQLTETRTLIQSLGLVTRSVADTLSQIVRLFTIIRFLLGSFGAVALVVALFGMFNTLTVSLLERTREIGVMKSLGTTNFDVRRIFMAESVFISTIGGVLGVVLGVVVGRILNVALVRINSNGQSIFMLPWTFALFIVVLAMVVGVVTGWYPSRRAAKISALNALRYE